jgi:Tfp pilus assembly protein FimT
MKRQMTKRRATAGFTMIETVMVLLVSLVLMAFAIPLVTSVVYGYRLRGAVSSVTWAIQSTRFQALEEGYPFRVTISGATSPVYQISSAPVTPTTFTNLGSPVPVSGTTVTLNQTTALDFSPNGSVTASTGALACTIAYQGNTKTITVSTYGNVKVTP